jgi:hypothetical protein
LYESNNKTILLHEPHTLDSWRKPEEKEKYQNRRKNTVERINKRKQPLVNEGEVVFFSR